ncbi:MAG: tetratricopeptide repeat protein [Solirubrobacterales bacterium]
MAKVNPIKLKQDADKEEKAGRLDKAIDFLKQLVADNPKDWNTINKIGDLYGKLNNVKAANEQYAKVAEFYSKDGFYLKAIAVWKKINKNDPTVLEPYLNLADLYSKQGLMVDAKAQYEWVFNEYIKRGRVRDAGDALRKLADIDPADLKIRSRLADLYMRDGNSAKAIEEHIAIADELGKKGHLAEALQVLEKGLKLDAKSARLRSELARIHLLQKNYEKAVNVLEDAARQVPGDREVSLRLAEAYVGAKRPADAETLLRRILQQDPNDQDARTQMGRVFLMQGQFDAAFDQFLPIVDKLIERKDSDRAAGILQQITQRSAGHVKSLNKLVEIYRASRKDALVAQTYSQIVEAYLQQGQNDQAASVLEILVGLEPHNDQHKSKLEFVRAGKAGAARPAAPQRPATPAPAPAVEEDFELATDDSPGLSFEPVAASSPALTAPAAPGRVSITLSGPLGEDDKEFVTEHLAEGRVFRKYGLVDKARDQFDAIIARFPDNSEARLELRDVYKEKGETAAALEQLAALAEIARLQGDKTGAAKYAAEIQQIAPAPVQAQAPPPPEAPPPVAAPAARPAPVAAKAPAPAPAPPVGVEAPEEEEIPLEVEEGGLEEPALEAEAESELQNLDLEIEPGGDELTAPFVEEELAAAPPDEGLVLDAPGEDGGLAFEEPALEEPEPPPPPPPPKPAPRPAAPAVKPAAPAPSKPSRIAPKPAAPPPAPPAARRASLQAKPAAPVPSAKGGVPPELQKVLDEVASYVSLGFVDDAKEVLAEMAQRFPGHPALVQKLSELGFDEAEGARAAPPPPPPAPSRPSPSKPPAPSQPAPSRPAPPKPSARPARVPEPEPEPEQLPEPTYDDDATSLLDEPDLDLDLESSPEPPPMEESMAPPELDDPLGDLGLQEGPDFAPSPGYAAADEGGLDLGDELGNLFGAQSAVADDPTPLGGTDLGDAGLADIFKEFKRGVDKQLGKEDYDTRYNLGIAYKEMGLVDEAIAEFQLAAKDENRILECSSMLGICFLEKGMPKLAIKWFEKGLAATGRSEEEYQGLRYDLACALESAGDTDRALSVYTELYGQDANFRDVANKVRELRAL